MQAYTKGTLPNLKGKFNTSKDEDKQLESKPTKTKGIKQIISTMFRCLQGLDDDVIRVIQQEILDKKVLLGLSKKTGSASTCLIMLCN